MVWESNDYKLTYDAKLERLYVELKKYYFTNFYNQTGQEPEEHDHCITLNTYTDDVEVLDILGVNDGLIEKLLDNEENRIKLCDFVCEEYMLEKGLEERCEL